MKIIDSNHMTIKKGDLVAVRFASGEWRDNGTWMENEHYSYWFATVAEIKEPGDVPHSGEPECSVKVEWHNSDNTNSDNPKWSWEDPKDLELICNSRKLKRILE